MNEKVEPQNILTFVPPPGGFWAKITGQGTHGSIADPYSSPKNTQEYEWKYVYRYQDHGTSNPNYPQTQDWSSYIVGEFGSTTDNYGVITAPALEVNRREDCPKDSIVWMQIGSNGEYIFKWNDGLYRAWLNDDVIPRRLSGSVGSDEYEQHYVEIYFDMDPSCALYKCQAPHNVEDWNVSTNKNTAKFCLGLGRKTLTSCWVKWVERCEKGVNPGSSINLVQEEYWLYYGDFQMVTMEGTQIAQGQVLQNAAPNATAAVELSWLKDDGTVYEVSPYKVNTFNNLPTSLSSGDTRTIHYNMSEDNWYYILTNASGGMDISYTGICLTGNASGMPQRATYNHIELARGLSGTIPGTGSGVIPGTLRVGLWMDVYKTDYTFETASESCLGNPIQVSWLAFTKGIGVQKTGCGAIIGVTGYVTIPVVTGCRLNNTCEKIVQDIIDIQVFATGNWRQVTLSAVGA